jgi:hypothetical protein
MILLHSTEPLYASGMTTRQFLTNLRSRREEIQGDSSWNATDAVVERE